MHRTNRTPIRTSRIVLLGLALAGLTAAASGQPPMPPAGAGKGWSSESPVTRPSATGIPGSKAIIVPINSTQTLKMASGKRIKSGRNTRESVARLQGHPTDLTLALITGLDSGKTEITLIDEDAKEETFDVIVQLDVAYLKSILERTVPTANIHPVPGANNTIFLTGYVARAEDADIALRAAQSVVLSGDRIINALRVGGVQQVQLDVTIARVDRSMIRRFAYDFTTNGARHTLVSSTAGALGLTGINPPSVSLGAPNGGPVNLFLTVFNDNQRFFGLFQALRDENVVKLLAEPKLVTLSGRPASFLSGGEQAVPIPAGLGQVGVQFEEFGTRLNFLPIVLGNGRIHLEVEPEVSNLNAANGTNINGTVVPGRETQRIHTTVELEAGQTFALGGLIQRTVTGSTRKLPILGDLPFIGTAFSSKFYAEDEAELLVLVTPHLVDAATCDQLPKYLPGQETRTPDDFELFLEGILEAPRGQRNVCHGKHYVPAFKGAENLGVFPCGANGCGTGSITCGGLNASCGVAPATLAAPTPVAEQAPVVSQPLHTTPVPVMTPVPAPVMPVAPAPEPIAAPKTTALSVTAPEPGEPEYNVPVTATVPPAAAPAPPTPPVPAAPGAAASAPAIAVPILPPPAAPVRPVSVAPVVVEPEGDDRP